MPLCTHTKANQKEHRHPSWADQCRRRYREQYDHRLLVVFTRRQYARAWKAWKKANHIRRALAALTGNRNGPAKAWADECRVMLARAERAHRRALNQQ